MRGFKVSPKPLSSKWHFLETKETSLSGVAWVRLVVAEVVNTSP